jgi:hypothetical protein
MFLFKFETVIIQALSDNIMSVEAPYKVNVDV